MLLEDIEIEDDWDTDPDDEDWGEQEGDDMTNTKIVATVEEGLDELRAFIREHGNSAQRVAHAILARDNTTGELKAVLKPARPCYGEFRRYGAISTRPKDHKPGDLSQPIDFDYRGIAAAIPFLFSSIYVPDGTKNIAERANLVADTLLDEEQSPWRAAIKGREIVYGDDGVARGFIAKDPDIDSTWLVSLGMNLRYFNFQPSRHTFFKHTYESLGIPLAYLMSFGSVEFKKNQWFNPPEEGTFWAQDQYDTEYFLGGLTPLNNFLEGKLTRVNPGLFSEGYDYNRPELSYVFFNPTEGYLENPDATTAWARASVTGNKNYISHRIKAALDNIHAPVSKLWDITGQKRYEVGYIVEHAQELKDAIFSRG